MTSDQVLWITKALLALWGIFSALEWYATIELFSDRGLLRARVLSSRAGPASIFRQAPFSASQRFVTVVLVARTLASITLILTSDPFLVCAASFVILLSIIYISQRSCFGGDGSDQMGMVVTLGVIVLGLSRGVEDTYLFGAGVFLIAGQATLAYFTAGAAKVVSPIWRSGRAIVGVMDTQTYGHAGAAQFVRDRPKVAQAVCSIVIYTEMLFPLILIAPEPILFAGLLGFGVFHCVNAYFMGLNSFVIPFVATYPAIMLANSWLRQLIW